METKAVYIHIPFCKKICNYCDFCKVYYQEKFVIPYLKMLDLEIKNRYQGEFVDTIYIGGGTPSCLSLLELKQLFTSIKRIHTSKDLEFTFECNASDITEELLSFLKENGVNRFSIGIESFQKEVLNFLGRTISKEEMIAKIELAKSYFSNINLDFIYAVPTQTIEMLKEDLAIFLSLDVTHISTYSLMIEEHTKLGIENTIPISDELDYQMYKMI